MAATLGRPYARHDDLIAAADAGGLKARKSALRAAADADRRIDTRRLRHRRLEAIGARVRRYSSPNR